MATPRGLTPLEAANEIRNANNGQVVLVLQGGGALGAYQGGVYQALHDAGIEPDWLIGTSIGAINASIIAGNKVEDRLDDAPGSIRLETRERAVGKERQDPGCQVIRRASVLPLLGEIRQKPQAGDVESVERRD
mgnify:CR=1 FL=1